ncbi:MAG: hypothetical protein II905_05040, partial [Muribaculaceae bacterium]|nr:hypothetical protein [Muribaculaceae bacterium]
SQQNRHGGIPESHPQRYGFIVECANFMPNFVKLFRVFTRVKAVEAILSGLKCGFGLKYSNLGIF